MLEKYIKKISNLRTDKGKYRYPALTNHRAPHKPFLLLSVMDLIAQGIITKNFIEPSLDLEGNRYGHENMPIVYIVSKKQPLIHNSSFDPTILFRMIQNTMRDRKDHQSRKISTRRRDGAVSFKESPFGSTSPCPLPLMLADDIPKPLSA